MTARTRVLRCAPARRLGLPILMTIVAVSLVGCGAPSGGQGNAAAGNAAGSQSVSQAFTDAYDKSFNESFAKSMHDSCVPSAEAHGASADAAERYCTCVVAQLAPLSVQEKQNLSPTSDKVTQAAAYCRAQVQ